MSEGSASHPGPPSPRWEPIDDRLLEEIYTADQAIYPAPLLTYKRLRSWAAACPDLCMRLRRPGATSEGVVIVLPVTGNHWERLISGELREHDVDPSEMFPPSAAGGDGTHGHLGAVKVGLHVFHVERYPPPAGQGARETPRFTPAALEEVRSRAGERFPSWEVVGYSGMWHSLPQGLRHGALGHMGYAGDERPADTAGAPVSQP